MSRVKLWVRALPLLPVLMLAGCFRPAGDAPTGIPADQFTAVGPTTDANALPPITLIAPDFAAATPTAEGLVESGVSGEDAQALPAMTMVTIAASTPTPVPTISTLPTLTLQIITPGISLGLLTPDTTALPTRTPSASEGGEATDEAGLGTPLETITSGTSGTEDCIYVVEAGDSLYSIAVDQDTTVDLMLTANPNLEGDPPILQIGEELQLPACLPDSLLEAEATDETEDTGEQSGPAVPEGGEEYIVQSGDTLGAIATRFDVTIRAIVTANNLSNPDSLSVGQRLIIPAPED